MIAAYLVTKGIRPAEFFAMPLLEQILCYEAVKREFDMEKKKLTALFTALGMKKAV